LTLSFNDTLYPLRLQMPEQWPISVI